MAVVLCLIELDQEVREAEMGIWDLQDGSLEEVEEGCCGRCGPASRWEAWKEG
jgi:hypothetical protein